MTDDRITAKPDVSDPRLGRVIAGRYRLDRVIGQGGLGRVYQATHLALGSPVAVKFIVKEAAGSDEVRARFKREAAALSLLRHPGIVAAHDFGEIDGDLYIVMEFVRGHALADEIGHATLGMEYATITTITEQVLQVIEAAHEARVVHRDLKPENIMLLDAHDRAAHVKVLDFGIALMDDREGNARLTETNAVQGTPLYMSPEQCRGRNVGPPTDIYAIGAILYEMLAGDTCFKGESLVDVMAQHMFVLPAPIVERGLKRAVPPELEALALWALSKKAEDRPTATQLRDGLANMLRGAGATQLAARSTEERIRAMGLTRNERGLPRVAEAFAQTVGAGALEEKDRPVVLLWGFEARRGDDLRSTLAVNGVDARVWAGGDLSTAASARAVVVAEGGAVARVESLRALPALEHLPVLAADVASATDTPALIRAGASDVGLAAIGDDILCKKLWRLLRRRR